ncbi:MAG: agmatine deiminase family protein [Verrucomicrobiales bacterium]|nr:agmatine deiminase family protein [Verrucomicrobiales bacterium]
MENPNYRFPAEWEPQEAVWFAWPTRDDLWDGEIEKIRRQLARLYVLAARYQTVRVLCPDHASAQLNGFLSEAGGSENIELFDYETDDVWCRDFGPLFVLSEDDSEICIADYTYNAWGNKFPQQERDNHAAAWIANHLGIQRRAFHWVLEGGAIESNGAGKILTTEVVLLNPNRNGPTTQSDNEAMLSEGLGIDEVIWLGDGLVGDDTDGHIDNLARFFKPDGILAAVASGPEDENFTVLEENLRRIESYNTSRGEPYAIVELPIPKAVYCDGERLAASYMNYLVINGAVLVPTYSQPEGDAEALRIIGECFPDREIVGFDCSDIVKEGGAIHCMSQHQPETRSHPGRRLG